MENEHDHHGGWKTEANSTQGFSHSGANLFFVMKTVTISLLRAVGDTLGLQWTAVRIIVFLKEIGYLIRKLHVLFLFSSMFYICSAMYIYNL